MEHIADMRNYIRSRQRKGKRPGQILDDLISHGYDSYAARGLVQLHWERPEENDDRINGAST